MSLCVSGCATPSPDSLAQNDPWENTNRGVFGFDVWAEHNIAAPVDDAYRAVVPEPAREAVHNVTSNLHAPIVLANDVLQGDTHKAVRTLGRIVINSTVGLGGLIDVASKIGIPYHDNDFGISLGKGGAAEGSYLVLPFLGPKPPRDLVGSGVDIAFDPLTYMSWNNSTLYMIVRAGLGVLDSSAANIDAVESIERSSIDFYATTRSLYRQNRNAQIHDGAAQNSDLPNF
jgi:phospholipid-binding lipoprotein MlaA